MEVFSDGSGTSNDKCGGFGWVLLVDGQKVREGNGHLEHGTNNDSEMEGAIEGLVAALKYALMLRSGYSEGDAPQFNVVLCSDSQITLGWADGRYKFKQEAKYKRFEILKELMVRLNATTRWVRGHSGNVHNERCDVLANLGRLKLSPYDQLPSKKKPRKEKVFTIGDHREGRVVLWYHNTLKLIDLIENTVVDHDPVKHGPKDSYLKIRE